MISSAPRLRFAPSPSGFMHLGNVRAALINYLYARQLGGTFILRIEDADAARTTQQYLHMISHDLSWLGLSYNEGPQKGGDYGPYVQSERTPIYQKYLELLQKKNVVYPCFCTLEELEAARELQLAQKLPPRYSRRCLNLSAEERTKLINEGHPFIWRFKLPEGTTSIYDKARGEVTYDLSNFSDFSIGRQDGSFTFIFANFVDDLTMKITHVFRGEDHLTNTCYQSVLYETFNAEKPEFYHLPIICNKEGKKLSKRDFGFSLNDLRESGFLPEAITNYLAILGGSFTEEIMSLDEAVAQQTVDRTTSTGTLQYDIDKLRWINQKWMHRLSAQDFAERMRPWLIPQYGESAVSNFVNLPQALALVQQEVHTLVEARDALAWCFKDPTSLHSPSEEVKATLQHVLDHLNGYTSTDELFEGLKQEAKHHSAPLRDVFVAFRSALTGHEHGIGIKELISLCEKPMMKRRLDRFLQNN